MWATRPSTRLVNAVRGRRAFRVPGGVELGAVEPAHLDTMHLGERSITGSSAKETAWTGATSPCSTCGTDAKIYKIYRNGHLNLSPPSVLGHEAADLITHRLPLEQAIKVTIET
jgi:hypothetical protein